MRPQRRGHRLVAAILLAASALPVTAGTALAAKTAATSPSPYPATLTIQRGLSMSYATRALPWGTRLSSAQAHWVTLKASLGTVSWGVWKPNGGPPIFPVRSVDGGLHWTAAGPQLATDWAGGGIYYVTRVLPESRLAVVMVSGAVIDFTVNGGHQWYQSVHVADVWSITKHPDGGRAIELRVGPAGYANLPKASYAIYALDLSHLRWRRIAQSLA